MRKKKTCITPCYYWLLQSILQGCSVNVGPHRGKPWPNFVNSLNTKQASPPTQGLEVWGVSKSCWTVSHLETSFCQELIGLIHFQIVFAQASLQAIDKDGKLTLCSYETNTVFCNSPHVSQCSFRSEISLDMDLVFDIPPKVSFDTWKHLCKQIFVHSCSYLHSPELCQSFSPLSLFSIYTLPSLRSFVAQETDQ